MIELLNIDCMEYMKGLEDNAFDMIVTSPPYDNLRDYGGSDWNEKIWSNVIKQCFRVLTSGGVMVWIVGDGTREGGETGTSFKQALYAMDCGFTLHDTMIWCKDSFSFPESNRYPQCFEYMFVLSKGKPNYFKAIKDRRTKHAGTKLHGTWRQVDGTTKQKPKTDAVVSDNGSRFNYWETPSVKMSKEHGHPASFPVGLAYSHMISWADKGSRILDPFLGSGSSALAAHIGGFDFVGCEIDKDYYKAAQKRFDAETSQLAMEL
jgi:DNA modification methylase